MKRVISFALVLIVILGLTGCSKKSKDAVAAEDAISAIGEVTLESENAILEAEKLYGLLTENEKATIENRLDLVNARETYDKLVQEKLEAEELAAAEAKIEKINAALPEATKLIEAFGVAMDNLDFISKYAGNVNSKGSMKFADSFIDDMLTTFDEVDMDIIAEGMPDLASEAKEIQTNYYNIRNMLIDMGTRNSAENVPTIKQMARDTIDMIGDLVDSQEEYVNSLFDALSK